MEWTKIEQEEEYLANGDNDLDRKFGGVIYQNHFVTLKQTPSSWYNALCFLNLRIYRSFKYIFDETFRGSNNMDNL